LQIARPKAGLLHLTSLRRHSPSGRTRSSTAPDRVTAGRSKPAYVLASINLVSTSYDILSRTLAQGVNPAEKAEINQRQVIGVLTFVSRSAEAMDLLCKNRLPERTVGLPNPPGRPVLG
jgi:hypothetical protein